MQVTTYNEFTSQVHGAHSGERMPLEVSIEVTRRCPLECLHCYNNLSMADQEARRSELTLAEHCRLLDELRDAGCLWLLYTGGEIFARKDFLDIYAEAKKRGFLITLFTNGTLITPKTADFLAEWRPFSIEITLYGATRETYEALTQIPGSFDRCMRGIRLLLERNLPLKLKTVPTTINVHEVYEMKRMAEEDFGVDFKFDALVNPRVDCSMSPLGVRLAPEEVVALDFHDPKRKDEYNSLVERDLARDSGTEDDGDTLYTCGGGFNGCAINPTGAMSICVISQQETYEWRGGSFAEGWNGFLYRTRTKQKLRETRCNRCRIQSLCSMCPANGELEAGDPESPVDFLCEVAHLRAYALDHDVPEHGECPYCAGGSHFADVQRSAERVRSNQIALGAAPPPRAVQPLTVLNSSSSCGSSGCGSGCRGPR